VQLEAEGGAFDVKAYMTNLKQELQNNIEETFQASSCVSHTGTGDFPHRSSLGFLQRGCADSIRRMLVEQPGRNDCQDRGLDVIF
jgi:hypothetical protein